MNCNKSSRGHLSLEEAEGEEEEYGRRDFLQLSNSILLGKSHYLDRSCQRISSHLTETVVTVETARELFSTFQGIDRDYLKKGKTKTGFSHLTFYSIAVPHTPCLVT